MSVEPIESGPYTLAYLETAPDDARRREIIDGGLYVTPGPSRIHQRAVVELIFRLRLVCPDGFEILVAPFDYRPTSERSLQPDVQHQGQLLEVAFRLRAVCPEHLQVLPAPVRFQPSDGLSLMPDVLVCRREDVGPRYVEQPPLLAIAVLSPVTRLVDTGFRRALYELSGVRSYWMFDPAKGSLTVLELEDGRYAERATVVGDEAFETDLPFPVRLVPAELIR